MGDSQIPIGSAFWVVLAGVLWGTVVVIVRVLVQEVDASLIAFTRILMAGLVLTSILLLRRGTKISVPSWRYTILAALAIGLNYLLFTMGLRHTLASAGAMVVQSEVVFLALLSVLFLGDSFGRKKAIGMTMALAGVIMITWNGEDLGVLLGSRYFLGNVTIFVAGLFWAIYVFFQKKLTSGQGILSSLSPIFLLAALFLFPFSIPSLGGLARLTAVQVLALLYLGILCTAFGYMFLARGMRKISASTAGVLTTVMPVTSVILAVAFLEELLTIYIVVGAFLDLVGVTLVVQDENSPP
jgi:drug/metabolite transporter (DMT)-like permease